MKEEREKEAARLALQEESVPGSKSQDSRSASNTKTKARPEQSQREERKRIAQVQELENKIAELEKKLADLGRQLENPPADAGVVANLGKEYESVQREMDARLGEWENLQG
jgi:TolA-binding protein